MEYLVHIMGHEGVREDPKKLQAMQEWPRPKTLKSLHGFLGLISYHRKCVQHYGKIAGPLTNLLKKYAFTWIEAMEQAFSNLKRAMCMT